MLLWILAHCLWTALPHAEPVPKLGANPVVMVVGQSQSVPFFWPQSALHRLQWPQHPHLTLSSPKGAPEKGPSLLNIQAHRPGLFQLPLPPLVWGNKKLVPPPLTVLVLPEAHASIFFSTVELVPSQPYVGQQTWYRWRLIRDASIRLEADHVILPTTSQLIGTEHRHEQTERLKLGKLDLFVTSIEQLLIPQEAGPYLLPPGTFYYHLPLEKQRHNGPLQLSTESLQGHIKALPKGPHDFVGWVGQLRVSLSANMQQVQVGEPVIIQTLLQGTVEPAKMVAHPLLSEQPMAIYPDSEQLTYQRQASWLESTLTSQRIFVAQQPGHYQLTLKPYTIFQPFTGRFQTIQAAPLEIIVEGVGHLVHEPPRNNQRLTTYPTMVWQPATTPSFLSAWPIGRTSTLLNLWLLPFFLLGARWCWRVWQSLQQQRKLWREQQHLHQQRQLKLTAIFQAYQQQQLRLAYLQMYDLCCLLLGHTIPANPTPQDVLQACQGLKLPPQEQSRLQAFMEQLIVLRFGPPEQVVPCPPLVDELPRWSQLFLQVRQQKALPTWRWPQPSRVGPWALLWAGWVTATTACQISPAQSPKFLQAFAQAEQAYHQGSCKQATTYLQQAFEQASLGERYPVAINLAQSSACEQHYSLAGWALAQAETLAPRETRGARTALIQQKAILGPMPHRTGLSWLMLGQISTACAIWLRNGVLLNTPEWLLFCLMGHLAMILLVMDWRGKRSWKPWTMVGLIMAEGCWIWLILLRVIFQPALAITLREQEPLYVAPSGQVPSVGQSKQGETMWVFQQQGRWLQVQRKSGQIGWVMRSQVACAADPWHLRPPCQDSLNRLLKENS